MHWRRMIDMPLPVDIVAADICYLGGISRTLRVVKRRRGRLPVTPHCANWSIGNAGSPMHSAGARSRNAAQVSGNSRIEGAGLLSLAITVCSVTIPYVIAMARRQSRTPPGWGSRLIRTWAGATTYQISEAG